MGGSSGMERSGQLGIYTENTAHSFDILDTGVRERGVKDDFLRVSA